MVSNQALQTFPEGPVQGVTAPWAESSEQSLAFIEFTSPHERFALSHRQLTELQNSKSPQAVQR